MNCATGPDLMTDHVRTLHEMSRFRLSCYPNAGLPNSEGKFGETPESLAAQLEKFAEHDRQKAELVKLRYFVGLTLEEAAELMGVSAPTAKRWWTYARAWLFERLERENC